LELEERIRDLRIKGQTASTIARAVGVELKVVTRALKKFEREYEKRAEEQALEAAAVYRHRMIEHFNRLKARVWEQIERAEQEKRKKRTEMLKDAAGKVTHQRGSLDTLPGETTPTLLAEIRQIEVVLGKLHGIKLDDAVPAGNINLTKNDVLVINPAEPVNMEKLTALQEEIRKRTNGGAQGVITVKATVPTNGNGSNGSGPR
jgi:hypothetical protein